MTLGYDGNLYILAFDHRGSFQKKFFGIAGQPTPEEAERISDAKMLIFEGFQSAVDAGGAPKGSAGVLVDEQFGAEIARRAKKEGYLFAMPVEKSGQDEFDFDYEDWQGHIEEFDPNFTKVLVRYNPEGDQGMNSRQSERLKLLGEWLHANDRRFLFELLVPAEAHQLEAVGGDADRYDSEVRPGLMLRVIEELHQRGVEPDIWKIEGIDSREDCARIANAARADGRDGVVCVVLGRGASDEKVIHWLRTGAGVPGYAGFAIGRTIWWDALKAFVDGESPREEAAAKIGANYTKMIDVYHRAEAGA